MLLERVVREGFPEQAELLTGELRNLDELRTSHATTWRRFQTEGRARKVLN